MAELELVRIGAFVDMAYKIANTHGLPAREVLEVVLSYSVHFDLRSPKPWSPATWRRRFNEVLNLVRQQYGLPARGKSIYQRVN